MAGVRSIANVGSVLVFGVVVAACGSLPARSIAPTPTPIQTQPVPTATLVAVEPSEVESERAPPTPSSTIDVSQPSSFTVVPGALGPFDGWSPDGMHFIANTSAGFGVLDRDAVLVTSVAATDGYWVSANSVAAITATGSVVGPIRFYDLSGINTGQIPGKFEGLEVAPAGDIFAAVQVATGGNAIGTTYRVWDTGSLSEVRDGVPLAWTPDASNLAVLVPLRGSGNGPPGEEGHVSIVAASGATQLALRDWISDVFEPFVFSPDGHYLAACVEDPNGKLPSMRVVDTQTASVSNGVGTCGYATWTALDTLYSSFPSDGTHVWTPGSGVTDPGFPPQTVAVASTDGKIASWSAAADDTLRVTIGTAVTDYVLSGDIEGVYWSPDGTRLLSVATSHNASGFELTVIRADGG